MKWTERNISRALAQQFFNRKYLMVLPNCNFTGHEADLLCVTENLRLIDVEIKISRADLKADAKKDKWWKRPGWESYNLLTGKCDLSPAVARPWPNRVWKHYYALPREIWADELLDSLPSKNSGVLLLSKSSSGDIRIDCIRRATPCKDAEKISAEQAVNIARLASLRMWDAYHKIEIYEKEKL